MRIKLLLMRRKSLIWLPRQSARDWNSFSRTGHQRELWVTRRAKYCWPLDSLPFPTCNNEQINVSVHYNKSSLQDPTLHEAIDIIRNAFWKSIVTVRSQRRTIKWHIPTTILHFHDHFGCFQVRFNDILPVVNSKIVDNYNNLLNWNAFLRNSQLEHARYE